MERRSFLKGLAFSAGLVVLDPILPYKRIWALGAPTAGTEMDFAVSYYGAYYWVSSVLLDDSQAYFPKRVEAHINEVESYVSAHLVGNKPFQDYVAQDLAHFQSVLPRPTPDFHVDGRDWWMRIPNSIT